ncbi:MAG: nucleotidyl transferase AbiEii/AbiGii toxin family protein [Candidatus Thermoplasmatota archaeon]|nr:nucleotidyl transferase AbiEii/AbiGii toxin family protein [Candidatus Thermoplasmatota archaeon]
MLTRRQLESLSIKQGVGLYVVERDYVQTLFLYELYKHVSGFLFKGGTCLRMGYNLNRYSEDLDFNFNDDPDRVMHELIETAARLADFGIESELHQEKSLSGFASRLRYNGPLYTGKDISKGTIRIDVSCRNEHVETTTKVLNPIYGDCPSFLFTSLTLDHIMAEKVRALLVRGKPRDLYDVWFLNELVDIDRKLIDEKLKLYSLALDDVDVNEVLSTIENKWKQDILPLLGFLPDFDQLKKTVGTKLQHLQKR